jgi:PII-like signaling protein
MKVTVARIYITEGEHLHEKIFKHLHDVSQVMGVTTFRGISGFGKSGNIHSSTLLDMSLDLPLIIEFFDSEYRVNRALDDLKDLIRPGHVITFPADLK